MTAATVAAVRVLTAALPAAPDTPDLLDRATRVLLTWAPLLDPAEARALAADLINQLTERTNP